MRTRSLVNAWRLLRSGDLAGLGRRLVARVNRLGDNRPVQYSAWRAEHVVLTDAHRERIAELAAGLPDRPSFTLVVEVGPDTDPDMLWETLESVAGQLWPEWVLYLATAEDLASEIAEVVDAVGDARVRITGPEPAVLGDWAAWVPVGDVVHEACLFSLAHAIAHTPGAATAYTDNDHVGAHGRFSLPHAKPGWNPDLLMGQNYLRGLAAYRADVVTGGPGGETPHERALRATAGLTGDQVAHVPHVLYSARIGPEGRSAALRWTGGRHISWPVPDPAPKVSLLIPTRDQGRLLEKCVASLIGEGAVTTYPNLELVLVDHESTEDRARRVIDSLAADPAHTVITFSGPFNFAAMVNRAAEAATGEVLVLLNNDTEAISPGWLTEMVGNLSRPEVGVVGSLLLFSDGTIQHAGVHPGVGGLMGHGHKHRRGDDPGYFGRLTVAHEVAAVTGACLGVTRANWEHLGGLDEEHLAVAYNDIDLCLRARGAGLRVVFTPHAVLHHHESVSRGFDDDPVRNERLEGEVAVMRERWGNLLDIDPAYSPNLTLSGLDFTLAEHPRAIPPWRRSVGA